MGPSNEFSISRLTIPDRIGGPDSAAFEELIALTNGIAVALWKNEDFVYSPEMAVAGYRSQEFQERLTFVARLGGVIIGSLRADFPLEEDAITATLTVEVAPAARGIGIGAALLARGEELAAEGGRTVVSVFTEHPAWQLVDDSELVHAAAGTAGLPINRPEVRMVQRAGYSLGQIERMSQLRLPVEPAKLARIHADAAQLAGPDYELVHWWRHAPDEYANRFAALRERMTTDVPHAGIALDNEGWNPGRVRDMETLMIERGEPLLTTVAVHRPSGDLAAYTELVVPDEGKVEQHDTLVSAEHRGHRLGVLVKAENILQLAQQAPGATRILTWNADENQPMRAVNDTFGFELAALTGNWQKTLSEP